MNITTTDAIHAAQILYPKATTAKEILECHGHQVFIIETGTNPKKVVLRFGNNNEVKYSLAKEMYVMNLLQKKSILIPKVILFDDSKEKIPCEFMILSYIEGEDLDKVFHKLNKSEQSDIAYQLGIMLGKIHSIKMDGYGYITPDGVESDGFSVKNLSDEKKYDSCIKHTLNDSLHDLGNLLSLTAFEKHPITEADLIYRYIVDNHNIISETEKPSLIHGDLDLRNVRVKKTSKGWLIAGILDFELSAAHAKEYDFIKLQRFGLLELKHFKESLMKGYSIYHSIPKDFDDKVSYFRNGRDIGFIFVLYKAGNYTLADELMKGLLKRISDKRMSN